MDSSESMRLNRIRRIGNLRNQRLRNRQAHDKLQAATVSDKPSTHTVRRKNDRTSTHAAKASSSSLLTDQPVIKRFKQHSVVNVDGELETIATISDVRILDQSASSLVSLDASQIDYTIGSSNSVAQSRSNGNFCEIRQEIPDGGNYDSLLQSPFSATLSRRKTYMYNSTVNRKFFEPLNLGGLNYICPYCEAQMWHEERIIKSSRSSLVVFSLCCKEGSILLPPYKKALNFLDSLLNYDGLQKSSSFRENIRMYNSMFQFTSTGGKIDKIINNRPGPYVFKIGGQVHHRIGSLLPPDGHALKFAQLYICDTENEISNRIKCFDSLDCQKQPDLSIVEGLMQMFNEVNEIVKAFRMARDRFVQTDYLPIRLRLLGRRETVDKQYDIPSANEIAGLLVGENEGSADDRDIIVEHKFDGLKRISELHPLLMSMQYPVLFPYGEPEFSLGIQYRTSQKKTDKERTCVTMMEYYAYLIQQRVATGHTLLRGGRLFQQFIVDAFLCVERMRLQWIRDNQKQLRSKVYQGVRDAVTRGDMNARTIVKRIILPSTFVSGPRFMFQNYQDAMAICRQFGHPDLFITFTCNPKWPEANEALSMLRRQRIEDRPDVLTRLFKLRLKCLMDDLVKKKHFGQTIAVVYTIEFQKRGLPYTHILLWLHPDDKYLTPTDVDKIISAEIPDKSIDPVAHEAVVNYMIHGPCGFVDPKAPCMNNARCSKFYPKSYQEKTVIEEGGFVAYRRRLPGSDQMLANKNGVQLDSRFVVPHNVDLIVRHQAHINVEICSKTKSIKYLFKYINKGPDRVRAIIEEVCDADAADGEQNAVQIDEIKMFLDCRYISAHEACWRLFGFHVHHREPTVIRLPIHLQNQHYITFPDNADLSNVLHQPLLDKTMFTEWMETNRIFPQARTLTYTDFPTKWIWSQREKRWTERKQGRAIRRINFIRPAAGELYFLRLLLNIVKGARNFEEIRKVNGILHPSFQEACEALGLLGDDREWHDAIQQASFCATGFELRQLFVTLIMFCEVSDSRTLWEQNWNLLGEDIEYRLNQMTGMKHFKISDSELKNHILVSLKELLNKNGSSLSHYKLPLPSQSTSRLINNRLLREEISYDLTELQAEHAEYFQKLNEEQKLIHEAVLQSVYQDEGKMFFVNGHGGTGKTFLWKTIIAAVRSRGKVVLAVASSGIASLLLPGGRTAHSRFKIPIQIDEISTCQITRGTKLAKLIEISSLIVWDEAPMIHRHCLEAFERSLRDVLQSDVHEAAPKIFGGKTILLGGDFRQILPVVPSGTKSQIINASINSSPLWNFCKVFTLRTNMRLKSNFSDNHSKLQMEQFAKWILDIGDGQFESLHDNDNDLGAWIEIPSDLLLQNTDSPLFTLIESIYTNFARFYVDPMYLSQRAIVTPFNETVDLINNHVLTLIPSYDHIYHSFDSVANVVGELREHDALYPLSF